MCLSHTIVIVYACVLLMPLLIFLFYFSKPLDECSCVDTNKFFSVRIEVQREYWCQMISMCSIDRLHLNRCFSAADKISGAKQRLAVVLTCKYGK